MTVEVRKEVDSPFIVDSDYVVFRVHRDRRAKVHAIFAPDREDAVDAVLVPVLIVNEDMLEEVERVLHAHTTVRERTRWRVEEGLPRGIVHVGVMFVREHELHHPERVVRSRDLTDD